MRRMERHGRRAMHRTRIVRLNWWLWGHTCSHRDTRHHRVGSLENIADDRNTRSFEADQDAAVNAHKFPHIQPPFQVCPATDGGSRDTVTRGAPWNVFTAATPSSTLCSSSPLRRTMGRFPANSFDHVPFRDVTITDETYWLPRINATYKRTLPAILDQLKATGRWDIFRLVWRPGAPNPPHIFWDRYQTSRDIR